MVRRLAPVLALAAGAAYLLLVGELPAVDGEIGRYLAGCAGALAVALCVLAPLAGRDEPIGLAVLGLGAVLLAVALAARDVGAAAGPVEALFAAFSDATARMPSVLVAGDRAAAEWTFEGRYTGQIPGLPPGTGQPVSFRGVSVLELAGGAIQRNTRYFDLFGLLVQTGAIPPAVAPGGAPETPES